MENRKLGEKILQLRKTRGLTQEELAEAASINLRTLQRIEQGKTEPRGQTLRLIAEALDQSPEHFLGLVQPSTTLEEDQKMLQYLNLSSLAFWFVPFGNVIAPLILWRLNRHKVKGLGELGASLLNFQTIWCFLCYGVFVAAMVIMFNQPTGMNPFFPFYLMMGVGLLYLLNTLLIVGASLQLSRQNKTLYSRVPRLIAW